MNYVDDIIKYPHPEIIEIHHNAIWGHIWIEHKGIISWETMQIVKNYVWGKNVVAVEMFPKDFNVVNSGNFRHLWRMRDGDVLPDFENVTSTPFSNNFLKSDIRKELPRRIRNSLMEFFHNDIIDIVDYKPVLKK